MPTGASGATDSALVVTMSPYVRVSNTASRRCASDRESSSARAASSSSASTRSPARGPLATFAGFAPKKLGVVMAMWSPASVKLSERWCPSNRHPHAPVALGAP